MKNIDEVREFFANDRFAVENGAFIEDIGENYAKCSMKLSSSHRNAMGAVMGGAYFTLADFAFAVAANWQEVGVVSLNSTISFISAAKGDKLFAEAKCIKNGRTTCFYQIDVFDELGNLSATVSTTGYRVIKK